MGFIDAVRAWLFGADEQGDETDVSASGGSADDPSDSDEPGGLDPTGVTETRTADATDDAVDALRDVRQSQGAGDGGDPSPPGEGNQPPDDDRTKPSDRSE